MQASWKSREQDRKAASKKQDSTAERVKAIACESVSLAEKAKHLQVWHRDFLSTESSVWSTQRLLISLSFEIFPWSKYLKNNVLNFENKSLVLLVIRQQPVKIFSKLNYFIFEYFDPTNNFFDNENE